MNWLARAGSAFLVSSFAGLSGCSSDGSSGDSGGSGGTGGSAATGGSAGSAGAAGSAGSGGSGPKCPGPGYHEQVTAQPIDSLTARVIDVDGNPAANVSATVCGTDICIYGSTDDQGNVETCDKELGFCTPGIQPNQAIKKPAFKFGLGITYVKWAIPLPAGATHALGDVTTARLPDISTGLELTPGADLDSGGIVLSIPADAKVDVDVLSYELPEQRRFRAVEVAVDKTPAFAQAEGFEIIVGTTPVDTYICPAAKLSVPNSAGWPAGTEVEFWLHSVEPAEEWAPYGGWAKVSDGAVSGDGQSVVTADGQGVPQLTVFGIKKK
jgi:hypothetical protein